MVIEPKDLRPDEQKERKIPTDCRGQRLVMVEIGYHIHLSYANHMPIEIYLVFAHFVLLLLSFLYRLHDLILLLLLCLGK